MVVKIPLFLLSFQNKSSYLQCIPFDTGEDGSPINIAAGIFYVHSFDYIPIGFRPPCGALMRPLPVSGGMQRESGTFLVSFPVFLSTYCFILNAFQNEKSNCIAC